jgi:hypothetical protein
MKLGPAPLALLLIACSSQPASAEVPAFPGAEGAGAMSVGGRGGRAIHVTNLNDSGPGSLRAALDASGPRTVIFDVGGTIRLNKRLLVTNGQLTIAGQTAPGGGITIRDYPLMIAADDVIVRFLRSRLGDESRFVGDAVWVSNGRRIILDHVSASWATDESLSVASTYKRPGDRLGDVTVQWSIISESLCGPKNPQGPHCYGSLVTGSRGARYTFHHNLWANQLARMPRPGNGLSPNEDPQGGIFDFRSNVMYNWASQAGYNSGPPGRVTYNFVGNSYWTGPDTKKALIFDERDPFARAWFAGNSLNGAELPDQWSAVAAQGGRANRLGAPAPVVPIATDSAAQAYEKVLRFAGASLKRDPVDARVVEGVRTRTGRLLNSQADVGGWPMLARGTPWSDSDGDGIPDDWERAHGLNPRDPRDGARVGPDGYSNLEHWLNALAAPAMAR